MTDVQPILDAYKLSARDEAANKACAKALANVVMIDRVPAAKGLKKKDTFVGTDFSKAAYPGVWPHFLDEIMGIAGEKKSIALVTDTMMVGAESKECTPSAVVQEVTRVEEAQLYQTPEALLETYNGSKKNKAAKEALAKGMVAVGIKDPEAQDAAGFTPQAYPEVWRIYCVELYKAFKAWRLAGENSGKESPQR